MHLYLGARVSIKLLRFTSDLIAIQYLMFGCAIYTRRAIEANKMEKQQIPKKNVIKKNEDDVEEETEERPSKMHPSFCIYFEHFSDWIRCFFAVACSSSFCFYFYYDSCSTTLPFITLSEFVAIVHVFCELLLWFFGQRSKKHISYAIECFNVQQNKFNEKMHRIFCCIKTRLTIF